MRPVEASLPAAPAASSPEATTQADEADLAIARLEGQVAALQAALERRSRELLVLQSLLCPRDLAQWSRVTAGLPPLPQIACEPAFWRETRELTVAEVPETLAALWSSLYPEWPERPIQPAAAAGPPRAAER